MKTVFFLSTLALSITSFAAPNCKYVLEQAEYAKNASGVLTVNAIEYKCSDLKIGEDSITVCKIKTTKKLRYDYVVAFDGAEADFGVYTGLVDGKESLCKGQATVK